MRANEGEVSHEEHHKYGCGNFYQAVKHQAEQHRHVDDFEKLTLYVALTCPDEKKKQARKVSHLTQISWL